MPGRPLNTHVITDCSAFAGEHVFAMHAEHGDVRHVHGLSRQANLACISNTMSAISTVILHSIKLTLLDGRCLERPESDTIPTAEPASVSATECDNSSGLKDLDACFDFLYRKGSLRTAPQLSRGAERTTPTAFSTPGKAASPSHTHDAVPDPELPGLASRGSNSCKAEGEVASWSELPDEAIIALLKREELLALAETRSYEVSINSLTKQLTGMQRHIRQVGDLQRCDQ